MGSTPHSVRTVSVKDYSMNLVRRLFGPKQGNVDCKLVADLRAKAKNDNAQSQNDLGKAFFLGSFGLAKDEVEAVKWYRKAAGQNDATAQFNLGWCYADGRGVTKGKVEAANWYRKAAEQNHGEAQACLGRCYYNGTGVTKDWAEAYKWENLARAQGRHGLSGAVLDLLEKELTPAQVAQVQELCRVFKPRSGSDPRGISWLGENNRRKTDPEV